MHVESMAVTSGARQHHPSIRPCSSVSGAGPMVEIIHQSDQDGGVGLASQFG
jgi:hypothetical protein